MQDEGPGLGLQGGLTRGVRVWLFGTVAVTLLQWMVDGATGGWFRYVFALSLDRLLHGFLWQPASYMLLHGNLMHLVMNMLTLYFFGGEIERLLGTARFHVFYLLCGLLGGVGWVLWAWLAGDPYALCLGASGSILGVIGAFAAIFPKRRITLLLFFVLPVTITARVFAIGMGVFSLLSLAQDSGGVAHMVHLAGGLAGYLYGLRLKSGLHGVYVDPFGGWETGYQAEHARLRRQRAAGGRGWFGNGPRLQVRRPQDAPSPDEVDRVLDKIVAQGMNSLTDRERQLLERAAGRKR